MFLPLVRGKSERMATITKTRFVIAVPDLKASAAFYRDVLGFTIHPTDHPGIAFYTCGACTIMAGECKDALPPRDLGDHSYFAYLEIDDVDAFYTKLRSAAVAVGNPPHEEPWGMKEFGIRTTDGHRIMFASPTRMETSKI